MFAIECLIYICFIIYSTINYSKLYLLLKKSRKFSINKDSSGLVICKEILNENGLSTTYVTKINKEKGDHYDIERNVIRLSKNVYDDNSLSALIISSYQAMKAIYYKNKKNKRKEKIIDLTARICMIIGVFLFPIGVFLKGIDTMTVSLILTLATAGYYYSKLNDKIDILEKNNKYLKKEYKISNDNLKLIENALNTMINCEICINFDIK